MVVGGQWVGRRNTGETRGRCNMILIFKGQIRNSWEVEKRESIRVWNVQIIGHLWSHRTQNMPPKNLNQRDRCCSWKTGKENRHKAHLEGMGTETNGAQVRLPLPEGCSASLFPAAFDAKCSHVFQVFTCLCLYFCALYTKEKLTWT